MASNMRKGKIPYRTTGVGKYVDETFTLGGFFGDWAHLFRRHNLAHPVRWSDPRLMYAGLDGSTLEPTDAIDPRGAPMTHAFYCGTPPLHDDIAAALGAADIASQRIGTISTPQGRDAIADLMAFMIAQGGGD